MALASSRSRSLFRQLPRPILHLISERSWPGVTPATSANIATALDLRIVLALTAAGKRSESSALAGKSGTVSGGFATERSMADRSIELQPAASSRRAPGTVRRRSCHNAGDLGLARCNLFMLGSPSARTTLRPGSILVTRKRNAKAPFDQVADRELQRDATSTWPDFDAALERGRDDVRS